MTGMLGYGHAVDHMRRTVKRVGDQKQQLPVLVAQVQIDEPLALGGGACSDDGVVQGIREHAEQVDVGYMDALGHGGTQVGGDAVLIDVRDE